MYQSPKQGDHRQVKNVALNSTFSNLNSIPGKSSHRAKCSIFGKVEQQNLETCNWRKGREKGRKYCW